MKRIRTKGLFLIVFVLSVMMMMPGCASSRKNTYLAKKTKASYVNTSQLGRNKYFFSPKYQKKLYRYKKR